MKEKKKKSFGHVLFSVIGWLLLAALLVLVAAFFLIRDRLAKEPLVLDDIRACAETASTGSARHLSFDADANMTVVFDKNDLWYFLLHYYGEDWMEKKNEAYSAVHLRLTGFGLELSEEDGIVLNVEAALFKSRLAFRVPCRMTFADGTLTVRPVDVVVLGHSISVNRLTSSRLARLLQITKEDLSFTYTPDLTYLQSIDRVHIGDGTVSFTGNLATDWLEQNVISSSRITVMRLMQESGRYVGPVLDRYAADPPGCYEPLLPVLQAEPGVFTRFLSEYYALVPSASRGLAEKNEGMLWRWYPDFQNDFTSDSFQMREDYEICFKILKSISSKMSAPFSRKSITVKKGELFYKNAPFSLESVFTDNYGMYSAYFDLENSRFCFYLRFPYGYPDYPPLSKLIDTADSISSPPEKGISYAPSLLLRGADGFPYLLAFTGGDGYEIREIDEALYHTLLTSEVVPVADLREPEPEGS